MRITVGVCDDEPEIAAYIKRILRDYCRSIGIGSETAIDVFVSGKDLLDSGVKYDMLFLDIRMPVMDGLEIAKRIRLQDDNAVIVFITSREEYLKAGYTVHAFQYLDKPIDEHLLKVTFQDALKQVKNRTQKVQYRSLCFETVDNLLVSLPYVDILFFETVGRSVKMVTTDEIYYLNSSLTNIKKQIQGLPFESPYKSFLVNMNMIKRIDQLDITMKGCDEKIPISYKKLTQFKKKVLQFGTKLLLQDNENEGYFYDK